MTTTSTLTSAGYVLQELGSAVTRMPVTNYAGLRRARRALEDAQFVPFEIHVFGGSSGFGWGADNPVLNPPYPASTVSAPTDTVGNTVGWINQARRQANARFAGVGLNAPGYLHATQDVVTRSGGGTVDRGRLGYAAFISNSGPGTLTFPLPACTNIDIDIWENPTTGTFTYAVDGGAATPVANSGLTATYRRISIGGLSNQAHTLVLTGTAGTAVVICGVRYHSGYGVVIGRHCRAGYALSDALGQGATKNVSAALQADLLNSFGMTPNVLNVVAFGSNDFVTQSVAAKTDLASFESLLRQVVAKNTAAGGCTLLLGTPDRDPNGPPQSLPAGPVPFSAYLEVMKTIAMDTPHCAHARHSDVLGSWAVANAAGLMADHAHPFRIGHGLMADSFVDLIENIPAEVGV